MPSHSSCDCAHSCMDLSQALAQVQSFRVIVFIKIEQTRREERRGGLMERYTLDSRTALT